jgi:4-amino-4-deoxy-L-arabinose transferase-like glycosyltransferase
VSEITTAAGDGLTPRTCAIVLGALVLLAAALRLIGLDSGFWYDEIVTLVESVRPPLATIVTEFPGRNNHPLYSVLGHASIRLFGEQPWSLRVPAMLFGVLGVPALYWLGTIVTTRLEALLAAGLLTVSYHHVWFSQNARGYTALLFWTIVGTALILRLLEAPSRLLALSYGVVVALGTYTHLTMAFVVVAHAAVCGAVLWWRREGAPRSQANDLALAFALGAALAVLLYLPLVTQVYASFSGPPRPAAAVATPAWALLEAVKGLRIGFGAVGMVAALVLMALGAWSYARQQPIVASLFILPAFVTAAGIVVTASPMRPRFFFVLLGFGLLLVVRSAVEAGQVLARWAFATGRRSAGEQIGTAVVATIALLSVASLPYGYRYPKQDFGGALNAMERVRDPSEPVATAGLASFPFSEYYGKPWPRVETRGDLERLLQPGRRMWVVYSFPEYMDPTLVEAIDRHCPPKQILHGTLGGGDVVVCAIEPHEWRAP